MVSINPCDVDWGFCKARSVKKIHAYLSPNTLFYPFCQLYALLILIIILIILEFVFALTIAFILTLLFALVIQERGRRTGLFWFFL